MDSNSTDNGQLQLSSATPLGSGNREQDIHQRRSDSYYFDYDPMAIFSVEDVLFRVHRHYLMKGSEVFRGMFASPPEEGRGPDGISDDQPIRLPRVTIPEFVALMDYLYLPPHARSRSNDVKQNLNLYVDLLSISHRFLFGDIFQYAQQQLEFIMDQVPVATRLLIGDAYGLKVWLSSAYKTLMDRQQAITVDECKAMGFERSVALLRAREFRYQERLRIAEEKKKRAQEGAEAPGPATRTPTSTQAVLEMFLQ